MTNEESTEGTLPGVLGPSEEAANSGLPVEAHGDAPDQPDTFPRAYVEELRDESAKYRQRTGDRDVLAKRLPVALVAVTGRLASPTDLAVDTPTSRTPPRSRKRSTSSSRPSPT